MGKINNKRKLIILPIILLLPILFTGCNNTANVDATEITNLAPLTLDEVAGKRILSQDPEQRAAEFRKLIEDKKVVDSEKLMEISEKDANQIRDVFNQINAYLTGQPYSKKVVDDGIFAENYANSLLLEFANTGFEWRQTSINTVGYDPKTRLFFVDVTYQTTGDTKSVVNDSKIPLGHSEATELLARRYQEYMAYAKAHYQYDSQGVYNPNEQERIQKMRTVFEDKWGTIDSILQEQQQVPLIERTRMLDQSTGGLGKLTYSGLISNETLAKFPATMTMRYVMKYRLNLGEETDLMVTAAYLKDYKVDGAEDIVDQYVLKDIGSVAILRPFIDRLIQSYNKAVEESNMMGLYSLHKEFASWDKYYTEIDKYLYNSFGSYSYEVLDKTGSEVIVKVTQSMQYRTKGEVGKGTESSLPQYIVTNIYTLSLGKDDTIYIKSVIPIAKELIGEPESIIRNITSVSDTIEYSKAAFSSENATAVDNLLKDFFKVVINNDISSQRFLDVVDLSISPMASNRITSTINTIQANKQVVYIINWESRTNTYASVRVKELFEREDSNYETESIIEMVNRGGKWRVVNYVRELNIRTEAVKLDSGENSTTQPFTSNVRDTQIDTNTTESTFEKTEFDSKVDEVDKIENSGNQEQEREPIRVEVEEPNFEEHTTEEPTQEQPEVEQPVEQEPEVEEGEDWG